MTMQTVQIRVATASDVPALFEVRTSVRENHLSREQLAVLGVTDETLPAMLVGSGCGWVACEVGRVLGFAMADAEDASVFALFLRPDSENRGIGRLLLQQAESWLREQGCDTVWLVTDADRSVRANGFYRHLGWFDDGVQPDGQVRFTKRLV